MLLICCASLHVLATSVHTTRFDLQAIHKVGHFSPVCLVSECLYPNLGKKREKIKGMQFSA